jgi:hypothetical protein
LCTSDVPVEHVLGLKKSPAPGERKKLEILFERRGIRGRRIVQIRRNGTMVPGEK